MSAEDTPQPSILEQAAGQAAEQAGRELAKKALVKIGAALGAKGAAIVGAIVIAAALTILFVVLIVSVVGAAFQSSTAVWPVSIATDTAGNYQASGWTISSQFGWRDTLEGGGAEFHEGLDLTNPQGACPFGYHCGAPSIFDGQVQYVGWDQAASGDPSNAGGGMMVVVNNGQEDHQFLYAHLEPYRLYVQLQGKIEDEFGRYDAYRGYQAIGTGALRPDLANGGIEMTCLNDMPNFIPTRAGSGTVVFLYDRPANCTTTVVWGARGDGWQGWTPDDPGARSGDGQRAALRWQTPIDPGRRAKDVALRFRAHLVPPPPPPTEVPTNTIPLSAEPGGPTPGPSPQTFSGYLLGGRGSVAADDPGGSKLAPKPQAHTGKPRACATLAGGWIRCAWSFADIPSERERFAVAPNLWIVAAQAYTSTNTLDRHDPDAAAGPAVSSEQLYPRANGSPAAPNKAPPPMLSRTPLAVTPTPAAPARRGSTPMPRARMWPPGLGGPEASLLSLAVPPPPTWPTSLPTPGPVANTISIVPQLVDQLWLHAPERPEHVGALLTISADSGEQVQITMRRESPAILGPGDVDAAIVEMQAGTLQNYMVPGFGFTVSPDTASGVQVCLTFAWRGLTSNSVGSTRACTVTADLPASSPTPILPPSGPGSSGTPDCAPLQLVPLSNVSAPNGKLVEPAAASFADVRGEILERAGVDALSVLADVLRQPSFTTSKPGVLQTSWHKAGRAVDLNQGGSFVRVAEGRMFRLYVGNVDITAIFEAHGWQRIPVQGDTLEWWHYEWHPDGIAWTSAMRQVWDLPTLQAAFPEINWAAIGCADGSNTGTNDPTISPQEREQMCVLGVPRYSSAVETIEGCGPPIKAGDKVYQLDTILGFVGLTGRTTGPHLHLGMKVKSYEGIYPSVDICTPEWLLDRAPPQDGSCSTDMADPLAFLPRAPGNSMAQEGDPSQQQAAVVRGAKAPHIASPTPIIPEGAPYQLPPPNYPNASVFTPVPATTPAGQYWSPYADGGQYGGGGVAEWFCSVWSGWPWCR